MNKILIILIIIHLINRMKANVYQVEPFFIVPLNDRVASFPNIEDPKTIRISEDINDGKINVFYYDHLLVPLKDFNGDLCSTDTSTEDGTLSTMLFKSIGIDSCPITARDYTATEAFQMDGIVEGAFTEIGKNGSVSIRVQNERGEGYFALWLFVGLLGNN